MTDQRLSCPSCPESRSLPPTAWRCPLCLGPLAWFGPTGFRASDIDTERTFIWRYSAALPVVESSVGFGEEATPLTSIDIGHGVVAAKLESQHPTASFKDRGTALLVNALRQAGVSRLVEDSSGNAAASLAAYAARAGIPCTIYAPAAASAGKLLQANAFGAEVIRVDGSRAAVAAAAEHAHNPDQGVVYASHNWHPWFVMGVATWALELWEQRGYRAPRAIVAPAGSGSLILGAWTAFSLLLKSGAIEEMPALFAAQPAACSPLVRALELGRTETTPFDSQPTLAEGASIANPVRGREVLEALRSSAGGAVAVSEDDIVQATLTAARQGILVEPTSALAVAATTSLVQDGLVPPTTDTVLVVTGSGLKTQSTIATLLNR